MIPTGFRDRKTTWRRQLREGLWSYGILLTGWLLRKSNLSFELINSGT
ncbi:hypothetical protein SLEP1_g24034 [Rubroshorea leprosula]|uniref:Uncharacterized protein n=1 Tax=Rubroshorea leprosula TaxID=152421 RepID=A0AAV5JNU3_9ROSI|nr:hypothetical protein SLEP1_g24034 [Rubroshorea leprosula]